FNLAAGATITGTTMEVTIATLNHPGTYNVTGTTHVSSGQANFTGTVTNVGTTLDISGGTVDFSSGEAITPTTLTMTGGTLTGSDTVPVSGLTTWSAGIMDGAGTTNCNGGIAFGTSGQKGVSRIVNSPGTATWTAGDIRIYSAGGTFNNSGTLDAQGGGTTSTMVDTGPVHNTGLFKRTTSTTITSVTSAFDNDGTVDVQTGGLILGGGGGASPSTGSFDATGTLLRFSQGTYDLAPSSSVTGTHVEFGFATVNHA